MHWRDPVKIFVNSMSDLFFEAFAYEEIAAIFGIMAACPQHTFQVLTKRVEEARSWFAWLSKQAKSVNAGRGMSEAAFCLAMAQRYCSDKKLTQNLDQLFAQPWPLPNVWLGASVEDQKRADERLPILANLPAAIRFVSYEPALEYVDFRPWIGYNPPHVVDIKERRVCIPGGPGGISGDSAGRNNLESEGETEKTACCEMPALYKVSDGKDNATGETSFSGGSSPGLFSFQGSDSTGPDDKSQGRKHDQQSSRQLRNSYVCRTSSPFNRSSGTKAQRSGRGPECNGEINSECCERDTETPGSGRISEIDRNEFRCNHTGNIKNSPWPTMGISWLIIGGESGHSARPFDLAWARRVVAECMAAGVPVFVKQLGCVRVDSVNPDSLRYITAKKGDEPSDWPPELRRQEFPEQPQT